MANIIIGSARCDENYKGRDGKAGDQRQSGKPDYSGEVSMQSFYVHKLGWYVLRPKKVALANKMADLMKDACNNKHLGYDQNQRLGVITNGIHTKKDTECDCSSLVRACVKEGSGKDPGNFTTYDEVKVLEKSGYFKEHFAYTSKTKLYAGDVLVSKKQGHTVIVVSSPNKRNDDTKKEDVDVKKDEPKETKPATTSAPSYTIGKVYTTQTELNVRTGPGTEYSIKKPSQWTENARLHDHNGNGQLDKGTKVTCKQVKKNGSSVWLKIPSGWICGYSSTGKVYVK